jgi:hypothetical protein
MVLQEFISTTGPLCNVTNVKVIVAGSKVEVVRYEKAILYNKSKGFIGSCFGQRSGLGEDGTQKPKSKSNVKRSIE